MKVSSEFVKNVSNKEVKKITFENNNGYVVSFYNYGGYLHSVEIPSKKNLNDKEDVLLGYNNFFGYENDSSYLNSIVGRVCGRISNSKFELNNKEYNLFANDNSNHLHGGKIGFNKKIWSISKLSEKNDSLKCILEYFSENMEEGYPGNLVCKTSYSFNNNNEFIIEFNACSDEDTIVNITNHNYWNFHGHKDKYSNIINHFVKVKADAFCEVTENYIPTGKMIDVDKSKYDFRDYKIIDSKILSDQGIDTCYSIKNYDENINHIASVFSNYTKMGMELFSNNPGLQFYTGNMMDKIYPGKNNKKYGTQFGLCLEPQLFPDAINHSSFKSPILRANEKYSSTIIMKFNNDF